MGKNDEMIDQYLKDLGEYLKSKEDLPGARFSLEEDTLNFAKWSFEKAKIRYDKPYPKFPIIYGGLYWANLGYNIGSEQDKSRPVIIIKNFKRAPFCYAVPCSQSRLEDGRDYHIDLIERGHTALTEHVLTLSKKRLINPIRSGGRILEVQKKDMDKIHEKVVNIVKSPR